MKRTLLVTAALLVTIGLASCKKDWTCDCGDPDMNFQIKSTIKSVAKTECEGSTPVSGNITGCTLK